MRELVWTPRIKLGRAHPDTTNALANWGLNLLAQKKFTEAEKVLRECLAVREKTQPDAWRTYDTQSMLGGSLLGQKKYAEAEPLLLAGYDGMLKRQAKIPATDKGRLTEALQRLVELYHAWGKPEEAAKWRKDLESRRAAQKQEAKEQEAKKQEAKTGDAKKEAKQSAAKDGAPR